MRRSSWAVLFVVSLSCGVVLAEEKKPVVIEEHVVTTANEPEKPLLLKVQSNGVVSVALDDHFTHRLVAFRNESGVLEFTCTDDHRFADMLVAQPQSILRLRSERSVTRKAERE